MSKVVKFIEKIASKIPGYGGYMNRENSRETDKALREYIAKKFLSLKSVIDDKKEDALEDIGLEFLSDLDRLSSILDRLHNQILYAARGYAGVFDRIKVYEDELETLYAFDAEFLSHYEELEKTMQSLFSQGGENAKQELRAARKALEALEKKWQERGDLFESFAK